MNVIWLYCTFESGKVFTQTTALIVAVILLVCSTGELHLMAGFHSMAFMKNKFNCRGGLVRTSRSCHMGSCYLVVRLLLKLSITSVYGCARK